MRINKGNDKTYTTILNKLKKTRLNVSEEKILL